MPANHDHFNVERQGASSENGGAIPRCWNLFQEVRLFAVSSFPPQSPRRQELAHFGSLLAAPCEEMYREKLANLLVQGKTKTISPLSFDARQSLMKYSLFLHRSM